MTEHEDTEARARSLGLWIGPEVPDGEAVLGCGLAGYRDPGFTPMKRDRQESFGCAGRSLSTPEAGRWLDLREAGEHEQAARMLARADTVKSLTSIVDALRAALLGRGHTDGCYSGEVAECDCPLLVLGLLP